MSQVLVATIFKANGPVSVTREGKVLTLKQGDSVFESDSINTGESSVELHFADGAKAMLGPQTNMQVKEFSMDAADPAFVLNLAAGLMRTISGEVVEHNPDAFKITTPRATVGIRGTEFDIKIHQDGSETIVLQQLDQGHNLVVTTHSGNQATLSIAAQGAHIPADSDADIEVKHFTPQEIEDLVAQLVSILGVNEEEENADSETLTPSIELEQSLVASASDESLGDLLDALGEAGIDVTVATAGDDDSLNPQDEVFVLPDDDDDGGGDDEGDGFISVSVTGAESYFADASPLDGVYGSQHISIDGNMDTSGVIISGDAQDVVLSGTTVTTANDTITGQNMASGTAVGDAATLSGNGTFVAGNDTITFNDKSGGDSIYGDVKEITGGTVSFGDDSIVISGTFSASLIAGDSFTVFGPATVTKWGNDTIQIATMTGGSLYGDDTSQANTEGGTDHISITDSMSGGTIEAGGGNDYISINNLSGGSIDGDYGDDTIIAHMDAPTITTSITGGEGNDSITITGNVTALNNSINGAAGMDTIHVATTLYNSNYINGGDDNDTILVDTYNGGSINGDAGDDRITVTNGSDIKANGGEGSDTLIIGNVNAGQTQGLISSSIEVYEFTNLNGGTIEGTTESDTITITNVNGGTYNTKGGEDSITISNDFSSTLSLRDSSGDSASGHHLITVDMKSGNLLVESGVHGVFMNTVSGNVIITSNNTSWTQMVLGKIDVGASLTLKNTTSSEGFNVTSQLDEAQPVSILGTLHGSDVKDTINLNDDFAGTIYGNGGDDTFILNYSMNDDAGGTIHGGAGNDSFNLAAGIKNTVLNGDAGDDTITLDYINNTEKGSIVIDGGANADSIVLDTSIAGTHVTLKNFNYNEDDLTINGSLIEVNETMMGETVTLGDMFITFTNT